MSVLVLFPNTYLLNKLDSLSLTLFDTPSRTLSLSLSLIHPFWDTQLESATSFKRAPGPLPESEPCIIYLK